MKGIISELSSGLLDNEYIILFRDGTTIYMNKNEEERYFNLNVGDIVYLHAKSPAKVFSELTFKDGMIVEKKFFEDISNFMTQF